jgi:hypothetical protein
MGYTAPLEVYFSNGSEDSHSFLLCFESKSLTLFHFREVQDMQKEASPVLSVLQSGLTTIGSLVVPSVSGSSDSGIHPAIDEYETKQRRRILSTILQWGNNPNNNNEQDTTKLWEDYTDWKIDRLVELFKALNSLDTHSIVSPLYQEITGNESKSFVEFVNDNVELFKDKFLMYCEYHNCLMMTRVS